MKRFTINFIATFLAFAAGLITASSWNSKRAVTFIEPVGVNVLERFPPTHKVPPPRQPVTVTAPVREFVFAQGRLKVVAEQVQLKSESLKYEIDVTYPQIVGTDDPIVKKVNQHIKQIATEQYQWPLNEPKATLLFRQKNPGSVNLINLTYDVGQATDSLLSIYFSGYHSGIASPGSAHRRLTLNYDLTSGKQLKLSDLFVPGSKYLEFISRYCIDELSIHREIISNEVAPRAENFESWHITSDGISLNFDGCRVFGCVGGDQTVGIPFSDLKPLLKPGISGKFNITYP